MKNVQSSDTECISLLLNIDKDCVDSSLIVLKKSNTKSNRLLFILSKCFSNYGFLFFIACMICSIRAISDFRELNGIMPADGTFKIKLEKDSWVSSNITDPFSSWIVDHIFYHLRFAPNFISILSLLSMSAAYLIIVYYIPNFSGRAPVLIYPICSLLVFTSQVLDDADGKQARKTGYGSRLGGLVDHGIDLVCACLTMQIIASLMQFGSDTNGRRVIVLCVCTSFIGFFCNSIQIVWLRGTIERVSPNIEFIVDLVICFIPIIPHTFFSKNYRFMIGNNCTEEDDSDHDACYYCSYIFRRILPKKFVGREINLRVNKSIIFVLLVIPVFYILSTLIALFGSDFDQLDGFVHNYTFPDTAPPHGPNVSVSLKIWVILYHMTAFLGIMCMIGWISFRNRTCTVNGNHTRSKLHKNKSEKNASLLKTNVSIDSFSSNYPYFVCWTVFFYAFVPIFNMIAAFSASSSQLSFDDSDGNPSKEINISYYEVTPATFTISAAILLALLCYEWMRQFCIQMLDDISLNTSGMASKVNKKAKEGEQQNIKISDAKIKLQNLQIFDINSNNFFYFVFILGMIGFLFCVIGTCKDMMNDDPKVPIFWFILPMNDRQL